jgi:iron transport multicopper oxidase
LARGKYEVEDANDRYDVIPENLILNNTLQIVYDDSNEDAQRVVYEGWPVLDDTEFVPVLKREMAPADIEYTLNVWFDVSPPPFDITRSERY